ncbi:MinD/ParA family protein [Streptomyces sp. NPDC047985]|uniref:MinD/ParA family ATP-binding protein n=1 Tax=Streptomyces sp. NPDC047985 TaxID=3155384 RepID=UPI00341CD3CE
MSSGDNWQGDLLRDLRGGGGAASGGDPSPRAEPGRGGQAPLNPPHVPGLAHGQPIGQGRQQERVQGVAPVQPQAHGPGRADPARPGPVSPAAPAPASASTSASAAPAVPPPPSAVPSAPASPAAPAAHAPASARPEVVRATGAQPPRTPDSRPVVDAQLAGAVRKPRHGESMTTRAVRTIRRIVSSSAAREVAEATRTAETLQRPVTTGRQIAVTSIRGGAGKSTVAALLGTTYAHYRQDPVLFVEADPALGSLPLRLGAEQLRWTTADIPGIVEPQMSLLDVTGYLVQLPDNAWLLPGSQGQIGAMMDSTTYGRAMVALRRYFGVTVVDCETLPAEVARVALSASQARVLTTPATLEGVTSTYAVLEWMRGLPEHVITGSVVVLTELTPHPRLGLGEAARRLESTGASVHLLPYDRHLAAGGPIRTDLLAQPTRQAVTRIAADAFERSLRRH